MPTVRSRAAARRVLRPGLALALSLAQLGWLAASGPARALDPRPPAAAPAAAPEPPGPRAMPGAGGRLLACESDGTYRRCPADTSSGVALVRELSSGRCTARSTWGFDAQAVWVDRGCRAEFRVAEAAAPTGTSEPAPAAEERSGGPDAGTVLAILGALVAGGAAAALLSGNDDEKSKKQQAVHKCGDRLDRLVRERGGRSGKILRIERARQRGQEIELEAVAKAEWPRGGDSRGRIECLVDLKGKNEILAFRQSGLWGGSWGGSGGSWNGSGGWGGSGGSWGGSGGSSGGRERAVAACERAAASRGLSRLRTVDADKAGRIWRVTVDGRLGGRAARAQCDYDQGRQRATITALTGRG
jgi:uncharacterized membrane protein YgcG